MIGNDSIGTEMMDSENKGTKLRGNGEKELRQWGTNRIVLSGIRYRIVSSVRGVTAGLEF